MSGPSRLDFGPSGNAGAFPSATHKLLRLRYRADPAVHMTAWLVKRWQRGDIPEPVMSASSGPKDYTANHVYWVFEQLPFAQSVWMLCSQYRGGAFFLLVVDANGCTYDIAAREVEVTE